MAASTAAARLLGHQDLSVVLHGPPRDLPPGQVRQLDAPPRRCTASARGRLSVTSTAAAWRVVLRLARAGPPPPRPGGSSARPPPPGSRWGRRPCRWPPDRTPSAWRQPQRSPPGPTILSTRGTALRAVGQGRHRLGAAQLEHPVRPGDTCRRQSFCGMMAPSRSGGVTTAISSTPAILAGMTFIKMVEGKAAGTAGHADAHPLDGRVALAHAPRRAGPSGRSPGGPAAAWKRRMFSAASSQRRPEIRVHGGPRRRRSSAPPSPANRSPAPRRPARPGVCRAGHSSPRVPHVRQDGGHRRVHVRLRTGGPGLKRGRSSGREFPPRRCASCLRHLRQLLHQRRLDLPAPELVAGPVGDEAGPRWA